jgi:hypothetical protein|tara:strand:- start:64 stop:333 length:270 start_codon:yes stop_codon:yes gene_type:complete
MKKYIFIFLLVGFCIGQDSEIEAKIRSVLKDQIKNGQIMFNDLDSFVLNNDKTEDVKNMVIDIDDVIGKFPNNENILKQMKKKIIIKED